MVFGELIARGGVAAAVCGAFGAQRALSGAEFFDLEVAEDLKAIIKVRREKTALGLGEEELVEL